MIKSASYKIFVLTFIILLLGIRSGKLFSYELNMGDDNAAWVQEKHIRALYPDFTSKEKVDSCSFSIFEKDTLLGSVIHTVHISENYQGFGGPVPILIGLSNDEKITGVVLLKNHESPEYYKEIIDKGFTNSWNNISTREAASLEVEAISGATLTSEAIISNIRHALSSYENKISTRKQISIWDRIETALLASFIALSLAAYFFRNIRKHRTVILIASVVVVGFTTKTFLSIEFIHTLVLNGINFHGKIALLSMLLFSIILPMITRKDYYCTYVCPLGALQELTFKCNKGRKISLEWLNKSGINSQDAFAVVILLVFVLTDITTFSYFEPYSAFNYHVVSWIILSTAGFFIALSFFTKRPWCRYFCIAGSFFKLMQRRKSKSNRYISSNIK